MIPENTPVIGLHVDIKLAENDILDIAGYRQWWPEAAAAEFVCAADGNFYCAVEIEKMSKSLHNVVNPDDIIAQYGADVFRMYEMFLGPLEQSKPWNTNGVTGVAGFLRKFWALFVSETDQWLLTDEKATTEELRLLHQTIKKVSEAIERLAFNTAIPQLMICTNELTRLGCHKQQILEPLIRTLAPFAPHVCEELWHRMGNDESVFKAGYPVSEEAYLAETEFEYPIQINGKLRTKLLLSLELSDKELESQVLTSAEVQKYLEGKTAKKVIIVPKKIVNVVI
jgi:leucyl-tRNA synthetase